MIITNDRAQDASPPSPMSQPRPTSHKVSCFALRLLWLWNWSEFGIPSPYTKPHFTSNFSGLYKSQVTRARSCCYRYVVQEVLGSREQSALLTQKQSAKDHKQESERPSYPLHSCTSREYGEAPSLDLRGNFSSASGAHSLEVGAERRIHFQWNSSPHVSHKTCFETARWWDAHSQ